MKGVMMFLNSLRTEVFILRNIQKMPPPEYYWIELYWYYQKVLLKSFPMNGHLGRFRQSYIYVMPLVTEVAIGP
jgi:hypothetical protein